MTRIPRINCVIAFVIGCAASIAFAADPADDASIARGRYVTRISGCNDCHTPGYRESAGKVAESDWLTGSAVGFKGPWGVTYPSNLRLVAQSMDEDTWVGYARQPRRPPMPWFNLRDMTDDDLRATYRFMRSLGPQGSKAPDFAPPGIPVRTPWILFEPQNLPAKSAAAR
ncbi:MAG: cytochrome C [Betaproteobacteria bacterium]